jgi:hypothetical protein
MFQERTTIKNKKKERTNKMLKVQLKEKLKKEFYYEDLEVGDVFLNEFDEVCIKTLPDECLSFSGEKWDTVLIEDKDVVIPIQATLVVGE